MAEIPIRQAKSLCSASEYELVHWSTRKRVEDLTPARLVAKRDRARKLRDKFRDLANQQKREIRGKSDARRSRPATDNRNTRIKEQLFAETVQRFEAALAEKSAMAAADLNSAGNAAGPRAGKRTSKKIGKKVAKKVGKKVAKKAGKKTETKVDQNVAKASKKSGTRKPAASKASSRKKAAAKRAKSASVIGGGKRAKSDSAEGSQATIAAQTAMQAVSAQATPKAKDMMLNKGGNPRIFAHVSSQGRRRQAKRDSR